VAKVKNGWVGKRETPKMVSRKLAAGLALAGIVALAAFQSASGQEKGSLKGRVSIDGSSTVGPIMTMAASMVKAENKEIEVTVGISGTGGGFKKFLDTDPKLRTDISNASRPIKPEEAKIAEKLGVQYIEIPIGLDGMAVVVNPKNDWTNSLTIAELKAIWGPDSKIKNWKDVRAGFPDVPLELFGPGTDSGTFDYFVEAVIGGGAKKTRSDFNASENDNTLVRGVAGNKGALGYFGFSYFEANQKSLKLLAIDNGDGKPLKPSLDNIRANEYRPLSRPLFIYVNAEAAKRPEVAGFVNYCLDNAPKIVEHPRVGYVALSPELYQIAKARFKAGVTGTVYPDAASVHKPLDQMFKTPAKAETP
jgi:phosphate transport system substrate-binding protein